MPEADATFGEQLRRYRARAGLTQEALAERAGLAAATVGALERGARHRPYRPTRHRLAEALGLSAAEQAAFVDPRPTATARPPLSNLPIQLTPLVGRAGEIAALRAVFLVDQARLVTLTGAGGCGKTRLALQLATELHPVFPGGSLLVELAPVTDPGLVHQAVAAAVGVAEIAGIPLLTTMLARLQQRPLVLVLDNCEHLVDACAALAERLLSACPELRILATSREPLQLAGEQQWRVPPLLAPELDGCGSLAELAAYPAVQLFVARARAVAPGFRLTEENAATVAQICARLDGLPLALELAAARVRVLTVGHILLRVDDAMGLLSGGRRAVASRQQTLRATLDWSHALLSPPEQILFRRLAVFAGGCELEAAEAVGAAPDLPAADVLDLLSKLVDKSLVLDSEVAGAARYRMLEPVRQYAAQHLAASPDADAVRSRHAACFLALAEQAAPELRGPAQVAWLARLDRERDNLRTALRWAEQPGAGEVLLRLTTALVPFWEAHGEAGEGRRWLEVALAGPATESTTARRVPALIGAGRLAHWQVDLDAAMTYLQQGLALARAAEAWPAVAEALIVLGAVHMRRGAFAEAVPLFAESLALYREQADPAGRAHVLLMWGTTTGYQGDLPRARALLEESLALYRGCGDLRYIAIARTILGSVLRGQGELRQAAVLLREALAGHRALGERAFLTDNLRQLAAVMAAAAPRQAARLLGAAEALREGLGFAQSATDRTTDERTVAAIRPQLPEADFAAAWAAGRALTLEQAVAEALVEVEIPPPPPAPAAALLSERAPEPLTPREREVARLIAAGQTDREIAGALAISARTVGVHVQHVIAKLGVRSRWQVADRVSCPGEQNRG